MPKASHASQAKVLTDIPNIGRSIAQDLHGLGVHTPSDVAAMDPIAMYDVLRTPMGQRHDPCVLDTFLAAKDFMNGGTVKSWWNFTATRKALLASDPNSAGRAAVEGFCDVSCLGASSVHDRSL